MSRQTGVLQTYFKQETGQDLTHAEICNAIRDMGDPLVMSKIPKLGKAEPVSHLDGPYTTAPAAANEFYAVLLNKIGPTIVNSLLYNDVWAPFYRENMTYAATVEEIHVDITAPFNYDAKDSVSPFIQNYQDVLVSYHDINWEKVFEITVDKNWVSKAFKNNASFDEFINAQFRAFTSSLQIYRTERVKQLLSDMCKEVPGGAAGGGVAITPSTAVVTNPTTNPNWVIDLNEAIILKSNDMASSSLTTFENAAGVASITEVDNQWLIVTNAISAKLDNLYANTFNMHKITPLTRKIVVKDIPQFAGPGALNGAKPLAILISDQTLILMTKLIEMYNQFNPRTANYNYFLHDQALFSYSLYNNAHIFYEL